MSAYNRPQQIAPAIVHHAPDRSAVGRHSVHWADLAAAHYEAFHATDRQTRVDAARRYEAFCRDLFDDLDLAFCDWDALTSILSKVDIT